ncbi:hypothetical protein C9374_002283 [Naegleria lovaniensis]|uniref:Myb-like domain-containing protein n=1 Tax=Naegleria lovaniensis TaxID=51637 RepID=A0AA88GVN4_NAELO|nr:uncharacterized protein C9374_009029 [Naegleria lovaniensis]XP_044546195.1 uncharacterized protein C9374_007571 [Naegleria lovaniensis]XP_044550531.1 uncharacterized protein C9374_002283 [Naegleria lovaniensis]KAG2377513.1 hypothetical protein C9374_009029 [Naegleria lovaniensis]KAG2378933.1 hypothetical protein C9374_007571 [Naegleria lovaniensis]KAG2386539.1 hypothetical protein C9374_002283 [Naegleria lovaniensis]
MANTQPKKKQKPTNTQPNSSQASSSNQSQDQSSTGKRWTDSEVLAALQLYKQDKDWEKVARKIKELFDNKEWNWHVRGDKSCAEKYRRLKEELKKEIIEYRSKLSEKFNNHTLKINQDVELCIDEVVIGKGTILSANPSNNEDLFHCHGKTYPYNQFAKITIKSHDASKKNLLLPSSVVTSEFKTVGDLQQGSIIAFPLTNLLILRTFDLFEPSNPILKEVWDIERDNQQFLLTTGELNSNPEDNVIDLVERDIQDTDRRRNAIQERTDIQRMHTIQHMTFYRNSEKWAEVLDKLTETFELANTLMKSHQGKDKVVVLSYNGKRKKVVVSDIKVLIYLSGDFLSFLQERVTLGVCTFTDLLNRIVLTTSEGFIVNDTYSFEALSSTETTELSISVIDRMHDDE